MDQNIDRNSDEYKALLHAVLTGLFVGQKDPVDLCVVTAVKAADAATLHLKKIEEEEKEKAKDAEGKDKEGDDKKDDKPKDAPKDEPKKISLK